MTNIRSGIDNNLIVDKKRVIEMYEEFKSHITYTIRQDPSYNKSFGDIKVDRGLKTKEISNELYSFFSFVEDVFLEMLSDITHEFSGTGKNTKEEYAHPSDVSIFLRTHTDFVDIFKQYLNRSIISDRLKHCILELSKAHGATLLIPIYIRKYAPFDNITMSPYVYDTIKSQNMVQGVLLSHFLEAFKNPCIMVIDGVCTYLLSVSKCVTPGYIGTYYVILSASHCNKSRVVDASVESGTRTFGFFITEDHINTDITILDLLNEMFSMGSKLNTHTVSNKALKEAMSAFINATLMLTCDTIEATPTEFIKVNKGKKLKKNTKITKYRFMDMGTLKFKSTTNKGKIFIEEVKEEEEQLKRKPPRPHMRSGYFRMQWFGSRKEEGTREQKIVWIGPSSVMGGTVASSLVFHVLKV